jgi:hypothetical protein
MLKIIDLTSAPASVVLQGLNSEAKSVGMEAYDRILNAAQSYELPLKDYLLAAVEPEGDLNGWEATLKFMKLPVRDDVEGRSTLQAAADVFQTQPGSRLLFPEVVMDMVKWKDSVDNIVTVDPMIAQTRVTSGTNELIMTEIEGTEVDSYNMFQIAEGGNIPIRKIKSSQRSVNFFKIGHGYEITYEFARRVSLDILTPYVNRINRIFEIDKVRYATSVIVNGDNVAGAITVDAETDFGGTNGALDWKSLFKWLVSRAAAGFPVDTLIGNYATYGDFIGLFTPTTGSTSTPQHMQGVVGLNLVPGLSFMNQTIRFAISNTVAASTLIGITKGETLEELREANSDIVENDRNITNQTIKFVRTMNIGYNLVTPLARRGFSFAA